MSSVAYVDALAQGGVLALLGLWSAILIRDHRRLTPVRYALAMNLGIACYIFPVGLITDPLSVSAPGFFWLFARSWFDDDPRTRPWHLIVAIIPTMFVAVLDSGVAGNGAARTVVDSAMRLAMLALALAGLWTAWRGRRDDLVEPRRRFRAMLIGSVGGYTVLVTAVLPFVNAGILPQIVASIVASGTLVIVVGWCLAMLGMRDRDLFAPAVAAAPPADARQNPVQVALAGRLDAHMRRERPYRAEGLTIAALASQLGEQEYRLRRLINGHLGYRNFAAFLNGYRLNEVREALADPAQRTVPILTIALDAGFGSLAPFNRAFREAEGMTPSAYRQARTSSIPESINRV
ncbi:MAG: AraC family transcriptional regulator [Sphingomonas sp.]|nr:AraC family transcriptional regulator [Sphingomonas sp.]